MTTTMKKFVDQFSRMTNSSNDDTRIVYEPLVSVCTKISITFKTTAPRCYYGHDSKLCAPNYLLVLSNSVSSYYIALGSSHSSPELS